MMRPDHRPKQMERAQYHHCTCSNSLFSLKTSGKQTYESPIAAGGMITVLMTKMPFNAFSTSHLLHWVDGAANDECEDARDDANGRNEHGEHHGAPVADKILGGGSDDHGSTCGLGKGTEEIGAHC